MFLEEWNQSRPVEDKLEMSMKQPGLDLKHAVGFEGKGGLWAIDLRVTFMASRWLSEDILPRLLENHPQTSREQKWKVKLQV